MILKQLEMSITLSLKPLVRQSRLMLARVGGILTIRPMFLSFMRASTAISWRVFLFNMVALTFVIALEVRGNLLAIASAYDSA